METYTDSARSVIYGASSWEDLFKCVVADLKGELKTRDDKIKEMQIEYEECKSQCEFYAKQMRKSIHDNEELRGTIELRESQLKDSKNRNVFLNEKCKLYAKEGNRSICDNEELQTEIDRLREVNRAVDTLNVNQQKTIASYQTQVEELHEEIVARVEENGVITKKNAELKEYNENQAKTIAAMMCCGGYNISPFGYRTP